ncbi:MAG: hypothetical protein DWI61_06195 [Chloroflexi bacterium]|nr:MAG: hypothetical protein DWI61_06195 [Chloroflexota bacterium]
MAEVLAVILWWLLAVLAGWLAWPLCARLLGNLPDQGYSASKACGLLLLGFLVFTLGSFGFLRVAAGSILMAAAAIGAAGLVSSGPQLAEHWAWAKANWRTVLVVETIFLCAFVLMAMLRALNPEILATEKPMELAFLSSIMRHQTLPAPDPWLSGYGISYYYFGYIIVGLMAAATGVTVGVAFNLALALVFALAAAASAGLIYNLVAIDHALDADGLPNQRVLPVKTWIAPVVLAPVLLLCVGNLNGLLEVLHQAGVGSATFWSWLNIKWLEAPAVAGAGWMPTRYLWWWQASRVIRDINLSGAPIDLEPIDEFPFFSFLLGDLHPHVLALPFLLLAISAALALYLHARAQSSRALGGAVPITLLAVILGGLAFMNAWDFPLALAIASTACAVGVAASSQTDRDTWWRYGTFIGATIILCIVLFVPFYTGFRSQAGGIIPNPIFVTRLSQFTVMFGVLLLPAILWLLWEATGTAFNWRAAAWAGPGVLAALAALCALLTVAAMRDGNLSASSAYRTLLGELPAAEMWTAIWRRRLIESPWTNVLLAGMLALAGGLAFGSPRRAGSSVPFVAMLAAAGAALTLLPDFVYLRDSFGMRLNTIFKFYYQAWLLWALVAAYAVSRVQHVRSAAGQIVFVAAVVSVIAGGLVYPVLAVWTKTEGLQGTTIIGQQRSATLDGLAYLRTANPDEADAQAWLRAQQPAGGAVAEAVGGSYTEFGRVSAHTGMPTLLGWPGHELQWRGGFAEAGNREEQVRTLYSSRTWEDALPILSAFNIRYVYVGSLERSTFPPAGLQKFALHMRPAFSNNSVTIYERIN